MGILSLFLIGVVGYVVAALIAYYPALKAHTALFYGLGLTVALLCNLVWLSIARTTLNPSQLLIYAFVWDTIIVLCYALVPVVLFGSRPSLQVWVGIVVVLVGLALTKF